MHDTAAHLHRFGELAVKHLSGENGIAILLLWFTILFAGVVTYIRTNPGNWSVRSFVRHLLPPEVFQSASARADCFTQSMTTACAGMTGRKLFWTRR